MEIRNRIEAVEERICRACQRAGRERGEVRLMGISKFHSRQAVEAAFHAGILLFGESRVQEAESKFEGLREQCPGMELHMVGNLQRNKAKAAALFFDGIQSVDRDELILELGKHASRDTPLEVLLELNAGEASKSGYRDEDSLFRGAEKLLSLPGLLPRGLMIMAPFTDEEAPVRGAFRALVHARQELCRRFPEASWSCLSMGMSGDFETAIEEGSTLVRIGSAIFGDRQP